jgi:LAS superfamily LD-carboxypeptidase LdcB
VGIEAVNSRIADIQSRLIAMQTQATATRTSTASSTTSASANAFATALADAVGAQSPTTGARADAVGAQSPAPTAGARADAVGAQSPVPAAAKSYRLNSKGIPTELAAYGNGRVPAHALARVGNTGHRLWAPAAESLHKMISDAKAHGVKIGITDSYRSYAEQVDLARRKGLYSQGGLAAKPGTSEHGWGMAADLDLNKNAQAWVRANGEKYGFVENTPREPWHWAYRPPAA